MNILIEDLKNDFIKDVFLISEEQLIDYWSEQSFYNEIKKDNCKVFIALFDKKVVGYIAVDFYDNCNINSFAVKEDNKNIGIGSKLLTYLENFCKEKNIEKIFLEVRESNTKAIDFYKKRDFYNVFVRNNFYKNPNENALLLDKTLNKRR
ncbi:MAG: ribosomal protein S18-alanine N-acetyltransferase [Oscillospiraceae bacterium]